MNIMLEPAVRSIEDPISPRAEDLIESFREDCELRKIATARSYANIAKRFYRWIEAKPQMDLVAVGKRELKEYLLYLQGRDLKYKTISHEFTAINSFYSFLVEEELVKANPVPAFVKRYLRVYKEAEPEKRQLISVEDAARLIGSTLETRDRAIIMLFLKTGMRRGEMVSLDVADVDLERLTLTLKEKDKRSNRTLFFDHECADALRRWLAVRAMRRGHEDPAFFISAEGTRISKNQIQRSVTKHAVAIGLHDPKSKKLADKFGPHCCRHWFTTHLLRAGMRREYVKWLRGDAIREAVDIYYHIDSEDVRKEYAMCIPQLGV